MPTGPARQPVGEPPVSVATLLARNGEAPGVPAPREPDLSTVDTGQMFLAELSRREGRPEDEAPPAHARGARLARTLAAVLLLAAVLGTGFAARTQPRPDRVVAVAPLDAAAWPEGVDALRPDVLRAFAPPGTADLPAPWDGFVDAPPAVAGAHAFVEATGGPPAAALEMLDPSLPGDRAAFRTGWDDVRAVEVVGVTALSTDEVRVVTALEYDEDGILFTVHRLGVRTDGTGGPLVTGVQLVSVSGG